MLTTQKFEYPPLRLLSLLSPSCAVIAPVAPSSRASCGVFGGKRSNKLVYSHPHCSACGQVGIVFALFRVPVRFIYHVHTCQGVCAFRAA